MTKDEITAWALANGWQMIAGLPSLTKPNSTKASGPKEAIVRLSLKATVAHLEVKKPAGKWEKVGGESYPAIQPDPDTGIPMGLGFEKVHSIAKLMQDNKDQRVFAGWGKK